MNKGARILCKGCKDIIQSTLRHEMVYCTCKRTAVDGGGDYLRVQHNGRDTYALVDDEGNEIVTKDEPKPNELAEGQRVWLEASQDSNKIYPDGGVTDTSNDIQGERKTMSDKELWRELFLALGHQIEAMEGFSQHGRFSPATNQDLLAHLILMQGLLRALEGRLKALESKDALKLRGKTPKEP